MSEKNKTVKVLSDLNLRNKPKANSKVITIIKRDEAVIIDSNGKDWSKIIYQGEIGYVSTQYLEVKQSENNQATLNPSSAVWITPIVIFIIIQFIHNSKHTTSDRRYKSGKRLLDIDIRKGRFQRIVVSLIVGLPLGLIIWGVLYLFN